MIKWLCRWILQHEFTDEYIRGWMHGVDQHRMEPASCEHHKTVNYYGDAFRSDEE
jgi:hypothetical protein